MELEKSQVKYFTPEGEKVFDENNFVQIFQNRSINWESLSLNFENNKKIFYKRLCEVRKNVDLNKKLNKDDPNLYLLLGLENLVCRIGCEKINKSDIVPLENAKGGYNKIFKCEKKNYILKPLKAKIDEKMFSERGDTPRVLTGSEFGVLSKNLGAKVVADLFEENFNGESTNKVTVDTFPVVDDEGQCFVGMEEAKGIPFPEGGKGASLQEKLENLFEDHPPVSEKISTFIRDATWLQIQDVLTGQVDRHKDNIYVVPETGHIMAFDFDLSFPTLEARKQIAGGCPLFIQVNGKAKDGIGLKGSRNFCLPPVIDAEMKKKILNIDPDKLQKSFSSVGLTEPEIQAAISRLEKLQEYVEDSDFVEIIDKNDWGNVKILQENGCEEGNFYAFNFL